MKRNVRQAWVKCKFDFLAHLANFRALDQKNCYKYNFSSFINYIGINNVQNPWKPFGEKSKHYDLRGGGSRPIFF